MLHHLTCSHILLVVLQGSQWKEEMALMVSLLPKNTHTSALTISSTFPSLGLWSSIVPSRAPCPIMKGPLMNYHLTSDLAMMAPLMIGLLFLKTTLHMKQCAMAPLVKCIVIVPHTVYNIGTVTFLMRCLNTITTERDQYPTTNPNTVFMTTGVHDLKIFGASTTPSSNSSHWDHQTPACPNSNQTSHRQIFKGCPPSGGHCHLKISLLTFHISNRDPNPLTTISTSKVILLARSLIGDTSLRSSSRSLCLQMNVLKAVAILAADEPTTEAREEERGRGSGIVIVIKEIEAIEKDLRSTTEGVHPRVHHHQSDLEASEIPVNMDPEEERKENKTQTFFFCIKRTHVMLTNC